MKSMKSLKEVLNKLQDVFNLVGDSDAQQPYIVSVGNQVKKIIKTCLNQGLNIKVLKIFTERWKMFCY